MAKAKQIEEAAQQEQTVELPTVEQIDDAIDATDEVEANNNTDDEITELLNEVPAGTPYSDMEAWKIREEYTRITGLVPADDLPISDMIQAMFNNFMLEQQIGYQMEVMQDQIERGVFTA
jgi:hypothetical protein